ncbi:MAG: hypothetical protein Q9207_003147 [Kuettlingeria erythrocarpa]
MADSIWAEALVRKQNALKSAKVKLTLDVTNVEIFEATVDEITEKYAKKGASKFVKERLSPHLEHIISFSEAIGTASQSASYGGAIWGGLLIVIESVCRFSRSLDEILTEVEALQASLPIFSEYVGLYSNNPGLQYCLRDLFEDYIDFCLCVVRYTSRNPALHILRNVTSSSSSKGLQSIKESIEKHKARFADKAEAAHRRNAERHYLVTQKLTQTTASEFASIHNSVSPESNANRSASVSSHFGRGFSHASNSYGKGRDEPLIHTVTLKRNTIFTGRDEELEQLQRYLSTPMKDNEARSCAVHGIGGVGKTQLALEYAYRYRLSYQAIFWLRAENTVELLESFSSIGNKLGIVDDVNQGRRVARILDWLETTDKRWLLVMDNLEELDTVAAVWPTTSLSSSSVILTTQKPCDCLNWADFDIPLRPLSGTAGSTLLLTQIPPGLSDESKAEQKELAMEISDTVGGLPLWLNALGGFIAQSQCSLSECLDSYRSSFHPLDQGMKTGSWTYEKTPSTVFDLAFSKLSDDAKTLLYLLAFLNPDGVPESMLSIDGPDDNLAVLGTSSRSRFFSAIANLRNSQLVKREGQKNEHLLTTHRSIQTAILHKLDQNPDQRQISFQDTCTLLRQVLPRPSPLQQPESDKWPRIQMFLPQLLSLEKAYLQARPPMVCSLEVAVLLSDVGLNIWDRGLAEDARSLMLTSEKILDGIGCERWAMERSNIHVLLGILTDTVGITQRKEGLRYRESAQQIREHHIDSIPPDQLTLEDEIRYYNTITDLACSHQQFNRYDEVEATCKLVIDKYRSWGTEEEFPYEFAKYYHHMAFVLVYRGDTEAAVQHASHATELLELGSFGLLATLFKFDCATLYFQNGQNDRAIAEHEEVLQRRLLKLGRSNIMTIQSFLTLGAIYYFSHDVVHAEAHMREAIKQCGRRPDLKETTVRAKFYMSLILRNSGEEAGRIESRQLAEEAKQGLHNLLPLDFPAFLQDKDDDDPILYDYLVPWTNRIFVEQQPAGLGKQLVDRTRGQN